MTHTTTPRARRADRCRHGRTPCPCPQACELPAADAPADESVDVRGKWLVLHLAIAAWFATAALMALLYVLHVLSSLSP